MRIFAVDDEPGALKLLQNAISEVSPDADLQTFSSSIKALNACKIQPPDVIFSDIQMPNMTGLEFAKKIKGICPTVNFIFVTGYSEYAPMAFGLRVSGYLLKPITVSDVKEELENLRYAGQRIPNNTKIYIKTFGNFEIFVNSQILTFPRSPAKEMLAYLIDRNGSSVTRKELASVLFEDEEYSRSTQSYITAIVKSLIDTLKKAGAEKMLTVQHNSYAIDTSVITCDAYEYMKGNPEALNAFTGEYMSQYSWAEYRTGQFYDLVDY